MKNRIFNRNTKRSNVILLTLLGLLLLSVCFVADSCFGAATFGVMECAFTFGVVEFPCGGENMGGMQPQVLVIPDCIVATRPELPADPDEDAEFVTATRTSGETAYTFKNDAAQPILVKCIDHSVVMGSENQGEIGGQSFHITGSFAVSGSKTRAASFARQVNNTPCDIILIDESGVEYIVFHATIKPAYTSGKAAADLKSFTFNYEADSVAPLIVLDPQYKMNFSDYDNDGTTPVVTITVNGTPSGSMPTVTYRSGASTVTVTNGDSVPINTVLTITGTGATSITVNGSSFTSGQTYTVTSATTIVFTYE